MSNMVAGVRNYAATVVKSAYMLILSEQADSKTGPCVGL